MIRIRYTESSSCPRHQMGQEYKWGPTRSYVHLLNSTSFVNTDEVKSAKMQYLQWYPYC